MSRKKQILHPINKFCSVLKSKYALYLENNKYVEKETKSGNRQTTLDTGT